VSGK